MKELSEEKLEKVAEIVDGERMSMSVKNVTNNKKRLKKLEAMDKQLIKNALEAEVIRPNEISIVKDEQSKAQGKIEKVVGVKVMNMLSDDELSFLKTIEDLDEDTQEVVIKEMFSEKISKEWKPAKAEGMIITEQAKKFVKLYIENRNRLMNGESYKTDEQIKREAGYSDNTALYAVMRNPYVAKKLNAHREGMALLREWQSEKMAISEAALQDDIIKAQSLMVKSAINNPDTMLKAGIKSQAAFFTALNQFNQNKKEKAIVNNIGFNISSDMAGVAMKQYREKEEFLSNSFK
jgi:hypothetical protein